MYATYALAIRCHQNTLPQNHEALAPDNMAERGLGNLPTLNPHLYLTYFDSWRSVIPSRHVTCC